MVFAVLPYLAIAAIYVWMALTGHKEDKKPQTPPIKKGK